MDAKEGHFRAVLWENLQKYENKRKEWETTTPYRSQLCYSRTGKCFDLETKL